MPNVQSQIAPAERTHSWRDLRATVRYRCAPASYGRVFLHSAGDQEYQRAWLSDLSTDGIGMVMVRSVPVGTSINICLRNPVSQKPVSLEAVVAHATQLIAGEWLVGCRFETPLSLELLDELLT